MTGANSIASHASQQANHSVGDRMAVSVLKQTLDQAEVQGQAAVSLIESAGAVSRSQFSPSSSSSPSEPGLGRHLDVRG